MSSEIKRVNRKASREDIIDAWNWIEDTRSIVHYDNPEIVREWAVRLAVAEWSVISGSTKDIETMATKFRDLEARRNPETAELTLVRQSGHMAVEVAMAA